MRRLLLSALLLASACQDESPSLGAAAQSVIVSDCLPTGLFLGMHTVPLPPVKAYAGGALGVQPGSVLIGYASGNGRTYYAVHPGFGTVDKAFAVKAADLPQFFDQADLAGVPPTSQPAPPRPPRTDELLEFAFRYLEAVTNTNAVNQQADQLFGL